MDTYFYAKIKMMTTSLIPGFGIPPPKNMTVTNSENSDKHMSGTAINIFFNQPPNTITFYSLLLLPIYAHFTK